MLRRGNFSLVNAPESMAFASQEYGTNANITGNEYINGVTATDYRGNTQVWDVTANASNFTGDEILASALNLYADEGDITNIAGDFNYVAVGGSGTLDGGIILFNGSNLAEGVFQYDNGFINLTVDGTDPAGAYTATLIYTLA